MAVVSNINADDTALQLIHALAELAEARNLMVAHADEALAEFDAVTAEAVATIRCDGARLEIDEARVEQDVAAFVGKVVEPKRAWFVTQRAAAAAAARAGIAARMAVAPPQV